jgi:hypothetical protein
VTYTPSTRPRLWSSASWLIQISLTTKSRISAALLTNRSGNQTQTSGHALNKSVQAMATPTEPTSKGNVPTRCIKRGMTGVIASVAMDPTVAITPIVVVFAPIRSRASARRG